MIYTTYFAKLRNLPDNVTPVSICLNPPAYYTGLQFKTLAPPQALLNMWHESHNREAYVRWFKSTVLDKLDQTDTAMTLYEMVGKGNDVALVCFEKSGAFCHRNLVAEWFKAANIPCEEYGEDKTIPLFEL